MVQRAIALGPDAQCRPQLWGADVALGQREAAVTGTAKRSKLNPGICPHGQHLDGVLRGLGRRSDAVMAYERAFTVNPGSAEGNPSRRSAVRNAPSGEAMDCYRRALSHDHCKPRRH